MRKQKPIPPMTDESMAALDAELEAQHRAECINKVFSCDYNRRHSGRAVVGDDQSAFMEKHAAELYDYLYAELLHYVPTQALDAMIAGEPREDGFLQYVARRMSVAFGRIDP